MPDSSVLDDILSQLNSTSGPTTPPAPPTAPVQQAPVAPPPQRPVTPATPITPAPQQNVAGTGAKPPNSQQSLRDKMRASNAGNNGGQVVLEQTEQYKEEGTGSVNSTIIESDDDDGDDEAPAKKGFNPKIIIGCIIVVILIVGVFVGTAAKRQPAPVEEQVALPEEELVFLEPVTQDVMSGYTAEEVNTLRGAGLTGTEIESYQNQGIPYITAYNITKEQFWAWQLENQLPITDMTSEAYKTEVSKTWLTLPERKDLEEWHEDGIAYNYNIKKNLDYEKVDVHGNQLFLKVYLDDNKHEKWFFLNVTPQEWNLLEEAGNVVVDYAYTTHFEPYTNLFDAVENTEDIFITSARLSIITDTDAAGF